MGWPTLFEVELDPWCRQVLHKNFPDAQLFEDVCQFDATPFRGRVDVLTGGFPCQDISKAGRGAGLAGKRSGLWREFARIIEEVRPACVVIENSPLLLRRGFEQVLADLARCGYDAKWAVVSAAEHGAPHLRERLYTLAYPHSLGWHQIPRWPECLNSGAFPPPDDGQQAAGWLTPEQVGYAAWLPLIEQFQRVDDGLPRQVAAAELKAYGNAVLPHIPFQIFKAIAATL